MATTHTLPPDKHPVFNKYLRSAAEEFLSEHGRTPRSREEKDEVRQSALMDMEVEVPNWKEHVDGGQTIEEAKPKRRRQSAKPKSAPKAEVASTPTTSRPQLPVTPVQAVVRQLPTFPELDWKVTAQLHQAADLKAAGKSFTWVDHDDERPPFRNNQPVLVQLKGGGQRYVDRSEWWSLRQSGELAKIARPTPEALARQREKRRERGSFHRKDGQLNERDRELLEFIISFKWIKLGTLATAFGASESAMYGRLRTLKRYRYAIDDRVFPYPALWRATAKGIREADIKVNTPAPPGNAQTGTQQLINYYAAHLRRGDVDLLGLGVQKPQKCVGEAQILSSYYHLQRGTSGRITDGSFARQARLEELGVPTLLPQGVEWDGESGVGRQIKWRGSVHGVNTSKPQALAKLERNAWLALHPEDAEGEAGDWVYLTFYDSTPSEGSDRLSRYHAPDLVITGSPSRDEQGHRLGGAIAVEFELTTNKSPKELRQIMEDYSANYSIFREVIWVAPHKPTKDKLREACGGLLEGSFGNIRFKVMDPRDPELKPIRRESILRRL